MIKATNKSIDELFLKVDKIQIKSDGVYDCKAISEDIVLLISNRNEIAKFHSLLSIIEPSEDFYCMCSGDYAIELFSKNEIIATVGYHHGTSIRYDNWCGDAELEFAEELLQFLFNLGLRKPLEQYQFDNELAIEGCRREEIWLINSPKCFSNYRDEINGFEDDYLTNLIEDLEFEIPEIENQILALLKSFGTSENLWSGYPIYETISQKILDAYNFSDIINAFENSDKEHITGIGLGRYIFSYEFRSELKKNSHIISSDLLNDIEKAFDSLKGIEKYLSVQKFKNYR